MPKRAASTRTYGAEDKTKRKLAAAASANVGTSTHAGSALSTKKSDECEEVAKKMIIKRAIKKESDEDSANKGSAIFFWQTKKLHFLYFKTLYVIIINF